jgi:nicotinamidase-related amidase
LKIISKNVFTKSRGNALSSKELTDFIAKNEICDFYIAGADATACVKSTCYNLCKADYKVNVLSNCITSWDKKKIPEMLHYYKNKGSRIMSLDDLLGSINAP